MPELPEVETVVNYLAPRLTGKIIRRAHLPAHYKRALHNCSLTALNKHIAGKSIKSIYRRAKYIVIGVESGILCIHLRMTGRLMLEPVTKTDRKYVTAWFSCSDGTKFYFKDVRKFGRIHFYEDPDELERKLGVEPLSKQFSSKTCYQLLRNSSKAIKPFLLDQTKIVGIGNIYADEILWAAKIHPSMKTDRISGDKAAEICKHTKRILKKSIKMNGTTFQSFLYGEEASGEFQSVLKVFGRNGEKCSRCQSNIEKIKLAQRGTHYCPGCQPMEILR